MDERERDVIRAAVAWWRWHRPIGWSVARHLENPTVNVTGAESSAELAYRVARYVQGKQKGGK